MTMAGTEPTPTPAAPTPAPAQPPVGQGAAPEQAKPDGIRGMFPNVPDEQWPLFEPHIKDVQGHITKLEQAHAPFKPFVDAGVTPEAATALIQLSRDFDQNPIGVWMTLGQRLQ